MVSPSAEVPGGRDHLNWLGREVVAGPGISARTFLIYSSCSRLGLGILGFARCFGRPFPLMRDNARPIGDASREGPDPFAVVVALHIGFRSRR